MWWTNNICNLNLGTLIGDDFVHPPQKKFNQNTHSFFLHPTFVLGLPKKKTLLYTGGNKNAFFWREPFNDV